MRNFFAIIVIVATTCGCTAKTTADKTTRSGTPDIYQVEKEDPVMLATIEEAKSTLAVFDSALKSNNPDFEGFSIKQSFKTDEEGGAEHIWIGDISIVNGDYYGTVNNQPEWTTAITLGQHIRVHKPRISDWLYMDNGKLKGGYTIRVLRNKMTPEEQKDFDAQNGMIFED